MVQDNSNTSEAHLPLQNWVMLFQIIGEMSIHKGNMQGRHLQALPASQARQGK